MPDAQPSSSDSPAPAPPLPPVEEGSPDPGTKTMEAGHSRDDVHADPAEGDFSFLSFGLCIALAFGLANLLEMPIKQALLGYALPIFLITQLIRQVLLWLRRSDRWSHSLESFRSTLDDYGGHFYGMVTFLTFLRLEFRELEALWRQAPDAWSFASSLSFERIFYFGVDSVMNGIKAALWPMQWFREYGSDAWLLILFAWLIYRAALLIIKPWLPHREPKEPLGEFAALADEIDHELETLEGELANLTGASSSAAAKS